MFTAETQSTQRRTVVKSKRREDKDIATEITKKTKFKKIKQKIIVFTLCVLRDFV